MAALSDSNGNRKARLTRKVRRGHASHPDIQAAIAARRGKLAAEVHAELKDEFGDDNVPGLRTVQDMMDENRRLDDTESWAMAEATPDEISALAPVWSFALIAGEPLSKRMAEWAVRILAMAQDIAPIDAYRFAATYAVSDGPVPWIDNLLAFRPWASNENRESYCEAANAANAERFPASSWALAAATRGAEGDLGPHATAFAAKVDARRNLGPVRMVGVTKVELKGITIRRRPRRGKGKS